jgi:peptidoglycan/LPS O-acetylase OafA/YrhL
MEREVARMTSLDVVRIIAIFLVVVIHNGPLYLTGIPLVVAETIGQLGVPLFVMLSGYLMLDRAYNDSFRIDRFLKHSILPLFIALEVWNVIWFGLSQLTDSPI